MIPELRSVGMSFPRWQDALEAAYASGFLTVAGEVNGGQLLHYDDPTGAKLVVLAAPPYGSFASFAGGSQVSGHLSMINDIVGVVDVVADSVALQLAGHSAPVVASLTANVAQGPLLLDADGLNYQPLHLAALASDVRIYHDATEFTAAGGEQLGVLSSTGIAHLNSPAEPPTAHARIAVEIGDAQLKRNALTGQQFWLCAVSSPFDFSLLLPADSASATPADSSPAGCIAAGEVQFSASAVNPAGCSPGGCGSGSCGCG